MKKYYIGILKRNKTIIVQPASDIDSLNCEISLYYGERIITKKELIKNKKPLLNELIKKPYFKECNKITIN